MSIHNKEEEQKAGSPLPPLRKAICISIFWFFIICSFYTAFFVSWFGTLVPFAFASILLKYCIRTHALPIFPYQRRFIQWLNNTNLYHNYQKVYKVHPVLMRLIFWIPVIGSALLALAYSHPVLGLKDMKQVHGAYMSYSKLRRSDPCGHYLIDFRLTNGKIARLWWSGHYLVIWNLQLNKGDLFTIWEEQNDRSFIPDCRRFPHLSQIVGSNYEYKYNIKYSEEAHSFCLIVGATFWAFFILFFSRLAWSRHEY